MWSVTLGRRLESVSIYSSWVIPGSGLALGTELVGTASDGFWVRGSMCDNIVALQMGDVLTLSEVSRCSTFVWIHEGALTGLHDVSTNLFSKLNFRSDSYSS